MTEAKTTARKPAARSGVKSESTGEAKQIRTLRDDVAQLRRAVILLSRGNLDAAQEELDSRL